MKLKECLYESVISNWPCGNIWLYSDPHFGDPDMPILRNNYISDEEQIKRINSKVGKNDTIIFLGDIGDTECIKRIRGYKVLVMGNHDKGKTNYKRDDLFKEVYPGFLTISKNIILSHEPIANELPYALNIYGHDHGQLYKVINNNGINLCAELIDYTPVSLKSIMESGILKNIPDIHRQAIDRQKERAFSQESVKEG